MNSSSRISRIVTTVIALIATPVGLLIVLAGGEQWARLGGLSGRAPLEALVAPTALVLAGALVLVGVVATGVWSSAGLLAVGVSSIVPVVVSLFPGVMVHLRLGSRMLFPLMTGFAYGHFLLIGLLFGAMGLVLHQVRRGVRTGAGATVAGLIAAPLLVLSGTGLLLTGIARGTMRYAQMMRAEFDMIVVLSIILGAAVLVAGVLAARWSRFALILPAVLLLGSVVVMASPRLLLSGSLPLEVRNSLYTLIITGGTLMLGIVLAAFTVVLAIVHGRAASAPTPGAGGPWHPEQHPSYPYSPQPATGLPGPPPGAQQPPYAPWPPAPKQR